MPRGQDDVYFYIIELSGESGVGRTSWGKMASEGQERRVAMRHFSLGSKAGLSALVCGQRLVWFDSPSRDKERTPSFLSSLSRCGADVEEGWGRLESCQQSSIKNWSRAFSIGKSSNNRGIQKGDPVSLRV